MLMCQVATLICCMHYLIQAKQSCARIAVWRDLGIVMSYTLESTFSGGLLGRPQNPVHFDCSHFRDMGQGFAETILLVADGAELSEEHTNGTPVQQAIAQLKQMFPDKYHRTTRVRKGGSNKDKKRLAVSALHNDEIESGFSANSGAESGLHSSCFI